MHLGHGGVLLAAASAHGATVQSAGGVAADPVGESTAGGAARHGDPRGGSSGTLLLMFLKGDPIEPVRQLIGDIIVSAVAEKKKSKKLMFDVLLMKFEIGGIPWRGNGMVLNRRLLVGGRRF